MTPRIAFAPSIALLGLAAAAAVPRAALAQQSFYNPSAAQPSTGVLLFRQTLEYIDYGDDPSGLDRDITQFKLNTQLAYGLTRDLTLMAMIPANYRELESPAMGGALDSDDFHLGDSHIMLKYRFWQRDTGPIDTMRAGLMFGLDIPTGEEPFDNNGWDPMIGAVFTSIQGRHGFNAAARYKFNTHERGGPATTVDDSLADSLLLDSGYLFRLSPEEYDEDTHGAWYAMAEFNSAYETNGDWQVRFAPGIMYEARNWVIEASVQLPVYEDLDHRPELDIAIGLGFRIFF